MSDMVSLIITASEVSDIVVEQASPWGIVAPWGLVAIAIVAIIRGDLVPSKSIEHIIDTYKKALEKERDNSDRLTVALTRLISQSAITLDIIKALPKPTKDESSREVDTVEGEGEAGEGSESGGEGNVSTTEVDSDDKGGVG